MSCFCWGLTSHPRPLCKFNPVQQTRRHFKTKRFGLMISSYLAQRKKEKIMSINNNQARNVFLLITSNPIEKCIKALDCLSCARVSIDVDGQILTLYKIQYRGIMPGSSYQCEAMDRKCDAILGSSH